MNKKKFKRELSNLCESRAVTPYYIEQFFRAKKSFFNDEKVEVLIKDNYEQMLKGTPKGNMNISINALYAHPEMREFMERDESIKLVLDTAAYYDFRDIVFDSDISARAQKFINDNFDYFASNAELKKMVSIFEYVDLTEENKDKMHEYFKGHKEGFLKEILTMTLSIRGNLNEKESDALLKIVTSIVDKSMEHEHAKVMDIKKLLAGSYSSVIRVGDTIIKVGTPRKTFDMPNDERILQPHLRRDLQKELGIAAVIEVADRVDTDFKITEEEMYEVYRDHFKWDIGFTVRDWRQVVRIANINTSNLETAGDASDTSANIIKYMTVALNKIIKPNSVKLAFYMTRKCRAMLLTKIMSKSNTFLTIGDYQGRQNILQFMGIPVRICDSLLETESQVL